MPLTTASALIAANTCPASARARFRLEFLDFPCTLTHNAQDAVTQARDYKGVATSYGRDALGNATQETSADSGQQATQYDALGLPGSVTDALGRSGPMPIAAEIDGQLYAIHSDHLNTPRHLTQADGQPAWQWAYSAYGDEAPTLGAKRFTDETTKPTTGSTSIAPVRFNLRYPGQYFDEETGLHYNYYRSYDPRAGRYSQPDPIGLDGGWNRFLYAESNPFSYTDPWGLQAYMCGPAGLSAWCGKPKNPPTVGVFGCVGLACLSSTIGGPGPSMSLELTLGGGLEICSPEPPPKLPAQTCEKNDTSSWQPPGIPLPERYGGVFVGPSIKRNGQFCVKFGPHMSVPGLPSIDFGSNW